LNSNDPLATEVEKLRQRIAFLEESQIKNEKIRAELLASSQNYRSILEASPS
jgi:hypothetical protein